MKRSETVLIAVAGIWLVLISAGLWALAGYEFTSGGTGKAPTSWPAESRIQRVNGEATLVMAVHPKCPCSRASIGELAIAMTRMQGRVKAHVLFYKPAGYAEDWVKTDLWRDAAAIPGVSVEEDEEGVEAERFGARVSGDVLLYDTSGKLRFHGGITASRGHAGENRGRQAVVAIASGEKTDRVETPPFGCMLHGAKTPTSGTATGMKQ